MIKATKNDRNLVIDILCDSFKDNLSVNYIVRKKDGLRKLMAYSFDICLMYGDVFLSNDKSACALIMFPDRKKSSLQLDIKLIFQCIGIANVFKAMRRESAIKEQYRDENIYYLWFIGVKEEMQGKSIGSILLQEILSHSALLKRPVYLETSTLRNLPWYKKNGFEIYHELDFGYNLFMLRNI